MTKRKDIPVRLSSEEINDLISALHFFISAYPNEGARKTKVAMKKLSAKMWKELLFNKEPAKKLGAG